MAIPFLGKLLDTLADRGLKIVDDLVGDKDLKEKLSHELKTLLSRQNHEIEKLEIEAERDMFEAQQATIQAELHQSDLYTKRTRPLLARRSAYLAFGYVIVFELGEMLSYGDGADWEVLLLLAAPGLAYMGVRGFEKWKAGGAK